MVKCEQQLCLSPWPKTMSNFPAAVPFVIVVGFPRLILKPTSDVQDLITLWTLEGKTAILV